MTPENLTSTHTRRIARRANSTPKQIITTQPAACQEHTREGIRHTDHLITARIMVFSRPHRLEWQELARLDFRRSSCGSQIFGHAIIELDHVTRQVYVESAKRCRNYIAGMLSITCAPEAKDSRP